MYKCRILPSRAANSPNIGINMHGFRFPLLSDQPPANKIISIPKTESGNEKPTNKPSVKLFSFDHTIHILNVLLNSPNGAVIKFNFVSNF